MVTVWVQVTHGRCVGTGGGAFSGQSRTLAGEPSSAAPAAAEAAEPPTQPIVHTITFYSNEVFTVNDGMQPVSVWTTLVCEDSSAAHTSTLHSNEVFTVNDGMQSVFVWTTLVREDSSAVHI